MTTLTETAVISRRKFRLPLLIWLSIGWLALMVVVAVTGDLWLPYDYQSIDLRSRLTTPPRASA